MFQTDITEYNGTMVRRVKILTTIGFIALLTLVAYTQIFNFGYIAPRGDLTVGARGVEVSLHPRDILNFAWHRISVLDWAPMAYFRPPTVKFLYRNKVAVFLPWWLLLLAYAFVTAIVRRLAPPLKSENAFPVEIKTKAI